jgi:threonine dehydrogenase-like Zn-dependent dehydrogenase
MKALVYTGPKQVELRDVPAPVAKEGKVKVDVHYCGICGSDIGIYLGTHPRAKAPLILGHEFLGILAEDGKRLKKGDRVVAFPLMSCGHCLACRTGNSHVCNTLGLIGIDVDGGICESLYVDEDVLFKVPDGVSDRAAVVTEPLAVILRAVHQAEVKARDVAVVIGAGPIGMLTGIVLKNIGASKVFISDVAEKRLAIAAELGLTPVNVSNEDLEAVVKAATDGEGCDVLFECSGSAQAAMDMTKITRVSGTICMVSVHKKPHEVNLQQLNFKEQWMIGTRVYTKEEFGRAVEYTKDIQSQLEKVVTHIVPMRESEKVFDMIADTTQGTVKVVVDCRDL